MLLSKSKYLPLLNRNCNLQSYKFYSKANDKVLGYSEKPNEFEITADYIGEAE